jgi:hypothetical protein
MTDTPSPDSLRPGSLVGPWRIEGYAGRGSYGLVFRARLAAQPQSPPVALKLAVFPGDPRFLHPAVPRLLEQGCWHASADAVHPYLVMEWIRGHPVSPRQAANGPLFTVDRPTAAGHCVPAQVVPVAAPEQPVAKALAAEPARASAGRPGHSSAMRTSLITLLVVLVVRSFVGTSQDPHSDSEQLTAMQAEAPDARATPDGGTRGLGDDALASRVEPPQIPLTALFLSEDLPKQPLPGQRRPPCQRKGAKVIQGGCWILQAAVEPPCGPSEYEWQGAYYAPMRDSTRPPTSEKPQQ